MDKKLCFLVQRVLDDGEQFASIMTSAELGNYINMADIHNESYRIFNVTEFGEIRPAKYTGWQPGCKIEVADEETGDILFTYYGEDH